MLPDSFINAYGTSVIELNRDTLKASVTKQDLLDFASRIKSGEIADFVKQSEGSQLFLFIGGDEPDAKAFKDDISEGLKAIAKALRETHLPIGGLGLNLEEYKYHVSQAVSDLLNAVSSYKNDLITLRLSGSNINDTVAQTLVDFVQNRNITILSGYGDVTLRNPSICDETKKKLHSVLLKAKINKKIKSFSINS